MARKSKSVRGKSKPKALHCGWRQPSKRAEAGRQCTGRYRSGGSTCGFDPLTRANIQCAVTGLKSELRRANRNDASEGNQRFILSNLNEAIHRLTHGVSRAQYEKTRKVRPAKAGQKAKKVRLTEAERKAKRAASSKRSREKHGRSYGVHGTRKKYEDYLMSLKSLPA